MNSYCPFKISGKPSSEKGMALVITLMILVIITALVVEFSYGIYTTTSSLYNWRDSQRLSFISRSGVTLAIKTISNIQNTYSYTYPARVDMPVMNIVEGFEGDVIIIAEDENSRFNLNSLIYQNGTLNTDALNSFKRLLKNLNLKEEIAEMVADWIDKDSQPRLRESEERAKNGYLDSKDELLAIKEIDSKLYDKLSPYITVYGIDRPDSQLININTATIPVIMSLDALITKELAERVLLYREAAPFKNISDIVKVAGFDGALGQSLISRIAVKASNFRITSIAGENKIQRHIESIVEIKGSGQANVKYWIEM